MKALLIFTENRKTGQKILSGDIEELTRLTETFGIYNINHIIIKIKNITPYSYIGKGKLQEIAEFVKKNNIDIIIFNEQLNYTQTRNIEEATGIRVIDRTKLILEIFKQRARTQEGKLQVQLAEYKYELSRLKGIGMHLDQQYGSIGVRGGAGEKKIEYDRRMLQDKISFITKQINKIRTHRDIQRKKRIEIPMPQISIVGYTNAGKSTLLNSLTLKNNIYADDKLFATLDPTTRRVKISKNFYVLFTDTVGFINKLPTFLVAAFTATLEEIKYSDLILHVHDISSENIKTQNDVVKKTLEQLGVSHIPVINVFNKIDLINNLNTYIHSLSGFDPVFISAKNGYGIDKLFERINTALMYKWKLYQINIKTDRIKLISEINKYCFVINERYEEDCVILSVRSTAENYNKILKIINSEKQTT